MLNTLNYGKEMTFLILISSSIVNHNTYWIEFEEHNLETWIDQQYYINHNIYILM